MRGQKKQVVLDYRGKPVKKDGEYILFQKRTLGWLRKMEQFLPLPTTENWEEAWVMKGAQLKCDGEPKWEVVSLHDAEAIAELNKRIRP